jgi:hypothetical protein
MIFRSSGNALRRPATLNGIYFVISQPLVSQTETCLRWLRRLKRLKNANLNGLSLGSSLREPKAKVSASSSDYSWPPIVGEQSHLELMLI